MANPERAAGRGRRLSCSEVGLMSPFETTDVVIVAADHVRRAREEFKVPCSERIDPIRPGQ